MKLVFITEARFIKDAKGDIYGPVSFNAVLWKRYLKCFAHVYVMARVKSDEQYKAVATELSSTENVSFIELPYYVGPFEYLKKYRSLVKTIVVNLNFKDAVYICRVPGYLSDLVVRELRKKNIPYGVEVVGDPWDVFGKGSVLHPLRLFFRMKGFYDLKCIVRNASAALYVTKQMLQKKYPISLSNFSTNCSDVKIEADQTAKPKVHIKKKVYELISTGSLEQMYKGPDIMLTALSILNSEGSTCTLTWLGDGIYRPAMEKMAKDLHVNDRVYFKGNVSATEVVAYLKEADLFVMATRAEGLPRAVIEAMAAGLPCVATHVGGIPELLDQAVLVPINDPIKLAATIKYLLQNADLYNAQAQRNFAEAQHYTEQVLDKRRVSFYEYLKNDRSK